MLDKDFLTDLDKSTISGFTEYTNVRYQGFTETLLSELEQIIRKFRDDSKTQNIIDFFTNLRKHFDTVNDGTIDLEDFSDEIVTQLYLTYRELGYRGTKAEMIMTLIKLIPIGTLDEVLAGINETKAVGAKSFGVLFNTHASSPVAHYIHFKQIEYERNFNTSGIDHLSAIFPLADPIRPCFPRLNEATTTEEFNWAEATGTIVIYYNLIRSRTPAPIVTITSGSDKIKISDDPLDDTIRFRFNDKIYTLSTNHEILRQERIVLSYMQGKCYIANLFSVKEINDIESFNISNIRPDCTLSYKNYPGTMYRLDLYPVAANTTDIRFLLN